MNFDWILFDADHTLFDFDRSAQESLADTIRSHGITHADDHWPLYHRINRSVWTAYENGEIDRDTMRTKRFSMFFEEIKAEVADVELFASQYLIGLPQRPYFIEGAVEVLQALHGKIRMGIITNGLTEVQRPRLESTGIDRLFEIIIVSGEIGMMKPDNAYFEFAYTQMARPSKERVLVVGDSLNADIRGGAEFGFRTCWFNPFGEANNLGINPDYEIGDLQKIPAIAGL
jgi:YjjG family noncanonical pyrimidine nucleotidase